MNYRYLDMQITLRCNARCLNCIKFCSMKYVTGLDYIDSDMTIGQIHKFIEDVKQLGVKETPVVTSLFITGGEPLLHSQVVEIVSLLERELVLTGLVGQLFINSNLLIKPPDEIAKYVVNFSTPNINPAIHNTVLLHPNEFLGDLTPSFNICDHYRKWRVVLNCHGYSLCCAADGYIRLFGLDDLIIDKLPENINEFPLNKMDKVCKHCPFCLDRTPLEKSLGRPVSEIYVAQANLNKSGRKITKTFPESKTYEK